MKLKTIFQYFTVAIIIIGASVIGITAHELKHYYDVKDESTVKEICVLNLPLTLEDGLKMKGGYFRYNYVGDEPESSELRAGLFGIFITTLISGICFYYLIRWEGEDE